MVDAALHEKLVSALAWYVDQGVTDLMLDTAVDRTKPPDTLPEADLHLHDSPVAQNNASGRTITVPASAPAFLGKSDAYEEAVKLARGAHSLEELRDIIAAFDGVALKRTATNVVFADGNPGAPVMVVGEAPGADEDRIGKPFVGVSGQLLDKILGCIGLDRHAGTPEDSVYISNVLNWRPPGNRPPAPAEIAVSLPFIERHIQLVKPKVLILCGGVAAQSLLGRSDSISRLRKKWHGYVPQTSDIGEFSAPAIATYHPSYLLRTPLQKRAVWTDMLEVRKKLDS